MALLLVGQDVQTEARRARIHGMNRRRTLRRKSDVRMLQAWNDRELVVVAMMVVGGLMYFAGLFTMPVIDWLTAWVG